MGDGGGLGSNDGGVLKKVRGGDGLEEIRGVGERSRRGGGDAEEEEPGEKRVSGAAAE